MGIPSQGWIAILIWAFVAILPWTYSLFFINRINKSGVERWGAAPKRKNTVSRKEEDHNL